MRDAAFVRQSISPGMKAFRCTNPSCELYLERRLLRKVPAHCRLKRTGRGCDHPVEEIHEELRLRCPNPSCPPQLVERLSFYAGRHQMDIGELGEAIIEVLIKAGLVKSLADLYRLKKEDMVRLVVSEYAKPPTAKEKKIADDSKKEVLFDEAQGGEERIVKVTVGEKRAENLLRSIERSKRVVGCISYLRGFRGIPNIGNRTAQLLASSFSIIGEIEAHRHRSNPRPPEMGGGVLGRREQG